MYILISKTTSNHPVPNFMFFLHNLTRATVIIFPITDISNPPIRVSSILGRPRQTDRDHSSIFRYFLMPPKFKIFYRRLLSPFCCSILIIGLASNWTRSYLKKISDALIGCKICNSQSACHKQVLE